MKGHTGSFIGKISKFSIIVLIFSLSCGKQEAKQEVQEGEPVEWYVKLGYKEVMEQIKDDTQLLTKRLSFDEFEEAEILCVKISNSFGKLNTDSPDIPEDFPEFKQRFEKSMAKLLAVCKNKQSEAVETRLKALKHTCRYCHKVFRKDLDASRYEGDFDVAVDKLYKNK